VQLQLLEFQMPPETTHPASRLPSGSQGLQGSDSGAAGAATTAELATVSGLTFPDFPAANQMTNNRSGNSKISLFICGLPDDRFLARRVVSYSGKRLSFLAIFVTHRSTVVGTVSSDLRER